MASLKSISERTIKAWGFREFPPGPLEGDCRLSPG